MTLLVDSSVAEVRILESTCFLVCCDILEYKSVAVVMTETFAVTMNFSSR